MKRLTGQRKKLEEQKKERLTIKMKDKAEMQIRTTPLPGFSIFISADDSRQTITSAVYSNHYTLPVTLNNYTSFLR